MDAVLNPWKDLLASVYRSRDRQARFYKPTCLFAVAQLIEEQKVSPDRIDPVHVLERFRTLVSPIFPRSEGKGFMPFWHLTNNRAWFCLKTDKVISRSVFSAGKPKTERQLLINVEYAAVPKEAVAAWSSKHTRDELKKELLEMLMMDDDDSAQAMGEYLRSRYVPPSNDVPLNKDGLFACGEFPDDQRFIENYSRYRAHMRIERSAKLVAEVKRLHGMTCAICAFRFDEAYGDVGEGYIEAHHLIPVARRKGLIAELDARHDFAVLCANCHRMVHRAGLPSDINEFRHSHTREHYFKRNLPANESS